MQFVLGFQKTSLVVEYCQDVECVLFIHVHHAIKCFWECQVASMFILVPFDMFKFDKDGKFVADLMNRTDDISLLCGGSKVKEGI